MPYIQPQRTASQARGSGDRWDVVDASMFWVIWGIGSHWLATCHGHNIMMCQALCYLGRQDVVMYRRR